jgi:hypothetical protein
VQQLFTYWRIYSFIRRIALIIFWGLLGLFLLIFFLLRIPAVQNYVASKATTWLSEKLETKVELKEVSIDVLDHLILKGLYIEDKNRDTLIYAGKLEVNIGTINPFAPSIRLKNISLSETTINIKRTLPDSISNYSFIADAFGGSSSSDTTVASSGGGKSFDLRLNKINISTTTFRYYDEVAASDMFMYIDDSEILINNIGIEEHVLALEKVQFDATTFKLTGLLDTIPSTSEDSWDTIHIAMGDWTLETTQLLLNDCAFYFKDINDTILTTGINFSDMAVTDINIDMSDILYSGDTIFNTINHLSLKEKSGFQVDTLRANVIFSPYEISLKGMLIKTPNSRIADAFGMSFSTLNSFDRFETEIRMDGNFNKSIISNKDIAYFASELNAYEVLLELSGHVYGTLDNLKGRDFDAQINNTAGIKGTLDIKGLPNIDETFLDLAFEPLYVNTYELESIIGKGKLPESVLKLGTINYNGRVTGFAYNLVTFGDIVTDEGNMYTDVNFQYDPETKTSGFKGNLTTTALNVGKISGQSDILGKISMTASIDGVIGNDNTSDFDVETKINAVEFYGYNYTNIEVDGEFQNDYFEGNFAIDDPNVEMTFNGIIDMQDSIPVYDFKSKIERANLKKLNFYPEPLILSATASMNAEGTTLDNMIGDIHFGDLLLIRDKYIYRLDTLNIVAKVDTGQKTLTANSNLFDFQIAGNYNLSTLPNAIKNMVNHYTNGNDTIVYEPQIAKYELSIKNADKLMAIFYPDIQVVRNLKVSGDFNTGTNNFTTRLRVGQFNYDNILLDTLLVEARTINDKLEFFTSLNSTTINNNITLPVLKTDGNFAQNKLSYNLKFGGDTDSNRINLNGEVAFIDSLMAFNILPSEIYFQSEKWDILANNSLQYVNNNIVAQNFTLSSGTKVISLSSAPDPTYTTILKLNIRNIPIGDLVEQYVLPGENIAGTLDATYSIGNVLGDPSFMGGAEIKSLTLNNVLLGNLKVNTSLISPSNRLKFSSTLVGDNGFTTDGFYVLGEGEVEDSIQLKAEFKKTQLMVVEPFLRGILSDMDGTINGALSVNGPASRPIMEGDLAVKKGGLTIDYLGTHYFFDQIDINIGRNKILIPETTVTDKLNNQGKLKGEITYSNFDAWNFRELSLKSENLILMETDAKQNPDLFGYAIGKVDANITGKLDALNIAVVTTPHSGTVVNLPTYGSGNVKRHDFIRFVNKTDTTKITTTPDELSLAIVDIDLKLNATPDAEIKLLINSEGTEYLTGKGFGALNIKANSLGKVDMTGTYRITEGLYDFSFQGLFQRPFKVVPGSTIEFSGSPYNAKLDLTAEYVAKDISVSSLTSTDTKEKTDVNVLINITGILESPQIDFDLEVPDGQGTATNNSDFQRRLQQVRADKNELNKQVFGLLITNSFLPQDLTTFNAVGTTTSNTINDFVSSQLTTYFQNVLNDFLKNTEIDIGYDNIQSGSYNYTNEQGKQIDIKLEQEINDNIIVKIGTTYYDFANGAQGSANNLAGDFEVEYIITPDGRVRVKAFRLSEYDAIIAKNDVKTGVGIYYTKDFNKVRELLPWNKK